VLTMIFIFYCRKHTYMPYNATSDYVFDFLLLFPSNRAITPKAIGISEIEYSPQLTSPDGPSTSGSFSMRKKTKNSIPIAIKNTPTIFQNFILTIESN
jgi:hypothetical protein